MAFTFQTSRVHYSSLESERDRGVVMKTGAPRLESVLETYYQGLSDDVEVRNVEESKLRVPLLSLKKGF